MTALLSLERDSEVSWPIPLLLEAVRAHAVKVSLRYV